MSQESIVATRKSLAEFIQKDHPTRSGKPYGKRLSYAGKVGMGKNHGTYGAGGDSPYRNR